jgi:hypothetical protein
MIELLLYIFVPLICIGIACWADLSAQEHIAKGHDEAMKILSGEA